MTKDLEFCPDCGDLLGEGLSCPKCQAERARRNEPQADPVKIALAEARIHNAPCECGSGKRYADCCLSKTTQDGPRIATARNRNSSAQEATMKTYVCPNPSSNPKCSGRTTREGGLCRSCGIRAGKAEKKKAVPSPAQAEPPAARAAAAKGVPPHVAQVLQDLRFRANELLKVADTVEALYGSKQ